MVTCVAAASCGTTYMPMLRRTELLRCCGQVNMLMSNKGTVLRCDVNGKIVMKVFLSGMPDVKLGLNDKLEVCAALGVDIRART